MDAVRFEDREGARWITLERPPVNVLDIATTLVLRLGCKHPGVPADQTLIRLLKIEESQTQPVD